METDWDLNEEICFVGDIERMILIISATVLVSVGVIAWVVFSSH
jgi:hypothetical protein